MITLITALATGTGANPNWIAASVATDPGRWVELLRESGVRLVMVVDQLEELFTHCPDEHERRLFLDLLTRLAAAGPGGQPPTALVIYGLRADFYAHCAGYPQLRNALQHHQILVGPMSTDQLREAILYPAQH